MRLAAWRRRRDDAPRAADGVPPDAVPADAVPAEAVPPDAVPPEQTEADTDAETDADGEVAPGRTRRPLYHRVLRLRHIAPTAWQRAAFADAPFALAVVLVLADVASAWTLLALPLAVAVVVKTHDLVAGALAAPAAPGRPEDSPRE